MSDKKNCVHRMRDGSNSELPKCEGHHLDQSVGDGLRMDCLSAGE